LLVFQGHNTIGLPAPVAQWTEHQPSKLVFTRQGALKTPRKCHFLKGEVAFSTQVTAYVQLQEINKVPLARLELATCGLEVRRSIR
jgi:hypothetical protein